MWRRGECCVVVVAGGESIAYEMMEYENNENISYNEDSPPRLGCCVFA